MTDGTRREKLKGIDVLYQRLLGFQKSELHFA